MLSHRIDCLVGGELLCGGKALVMNPFQHVQGKVCKRGSGRAAGVVSVHNLDDGMVVILQAVEADFVYRAQIGGKPFYHGGIGV